MARAAIRGPPSGQRLVEVIVNGLPVASRELPGDGQEHEFEFEVDVTRSSWIATRIFPHMHTNPIEVHVADKPIRASRDSARWCIETIQQLWRQREKNIAASERGAARIAFDEAIEIYRQRMQ